METETAGRVALLQPELHSHVSADSPPLSSRDELVRNHSAVAPLPDVIKTPPVITKTRRNTSLSYEQYFRDHVDLEQFKGVELKQVAKYNKISQTGTKRILMEKIIRHFVLHHSAVVIQKQVRRLLVSLYFTLSHTIRDRSLCVNGTDFYSMEPLPDISFQQFFTYTDAKKFTYGFDIHSLVLLHRKNDVPYNPYNRDLIPVEVMNDVLRVYRLIRILFPTYTLDQDHYISPYKKDSRMRQRRLQYIGGQTNGSNDVTQNTLIVHPPGAPMTVEPVNMINAFSLSRYQVASLTFATSSGETVAGNNPAAIEAVRQTALELIVSMEARRRFMMELRQKPLHTRVQELFMEIDQLGNYTDASWFNNLPITALRMMYRHLRDIWRFRAQIPYEIKHRISPIEDPFTSVGPGSDEDINYIRRVCLGAMENMVFTGFDVEYRKLGAMHVLTALTVVSVPARTTFFWLYETMY